MIPINKMNKKAYLQMSFQWIFALIVGAVILVLTIYGVIQFMNLEQGRQDIEKARQVEILLSPLESSFETGKSIPLETNVRTRINIKCNNKGEFGEQEINIQQENLNEMSSGQRSVKPKNRYVFTNNSAEGKKFFIFSKPFEYPFKVADLIYITSAEKNYCFQSPPVKIKQELESINQSNLKVDCSEKIIGLKDTTEICFQSGSSGGCDIKVLNYNNLEQRKIIKNSGEMYFPNDALMYAGIFSDISNYECNLKRLMKRTKKLSSLYIEKSGVISNVCSTNNIKSLLIPLEANTQNYNHSNNLKRFASLVEQLENQNKGAWGCRLW